MLYNKLPQTCSLRQFTFITSQCLWVGSSGTVYLGLLLKFHKATVNVRLGCILIQKVSCGEESASIVFLVVGRIHFLVVVELKAQGMLTIG